MVRSGVYQLGCLSLSLGLTAIGFFLASAPLAVAYVPLAVALCLKDKPMRFWLIFGHFFWVGVISAWGLYQLGYDPILTTILTLIVLGIGSGLMLLMGIGVSAGLLMLAPFFPANPLLITGSVFPGHGSLGVIFLLGAIIAVETLKHFKARVALLAAVIALGQIPFGQLFAIPAKYWPFATVTNTASAAADPSYDYTEIDKSSFRAITDLGRWNQIASVINENDTVILGENIFDQSNTGAISYWCRIAREKSATLFIGVKGIKDVGEVWRFDSNDCPAPTVIYRAAIGIPTITGGWAPGYTSTQGAGTSLPEVQWLACFEGFSLSRWLAAAATKAKEVIILSNDSPTHPIPTGVLRRKVGHQFAKLFDLTVVHADTGRNIIHVR